MSFDGLGLSAPVLQAVLDAGYQEPTPIQQAAIPLILQECDLLGCAQTGTGKTASFTLPMIDRLAKGRAKARMPRSLILTPTRELASQIAENFLKYGKHNKLTMALLIGGVSFDEQLKLIDRGVDVLIATPGRLLDHFERGRLMLRGVEILVIDEADRMLDMGFIPDVERIVKLLSPSRQTLMFSATMAPEIKRLADQFLHHAQEIQVAPPATTAATVVQALAIVDADDKRPALRALLRSQEVKNAFIFCNRKRDVDIVYRSLKKHGFNAGALHGDMSQVHRMDTLEKFRAGEINLLVCSDVAARGLDIEAMSHVFLFDLPSHAEDYVHRIGRTGRAGEVGHAFALATPEDGKFLDAIEKLTGAPIPRIAIDGIDTLEIGSRKGRRRGKSVARKDKDKDKAKAKAKAKDKTKAPAAALDKEPAPAQDSDAALPNGSNRRTGREQNRNRNLASGRRRTPREDAPVIGLGDHVPAFLLREPKTNRASGEKTDGS